MPPALVRPGPNPALPSAAGRWRRLAYRAAIPGAALLLYGGLAALWQWGPHRLYFGVLRPFGFMPFRFPFLDAHGILAAVQCHRYGTDVYLTNPCDALGRPHVYSPLWLRITPGFLDSGASALNAVGLGLGLLFIASLAALCRPAGRGEALVLALTALSPMTVYALERGNGDLVIFLLILAGCGLARAAAPWRFGAYGLYLFAGLLKYYPLVLLALALRERRRDAVALAALAAAIVVALGAADYSELAKALANIPRPSYFADSFAAVNLPFGLAEILNSLAFGRFIGLGVLTALVGLAVARTWRTRALIDRTPRDWGSFEGECMVAGALVLSGCFFAGRNIDYRGVFFVLVTPGLLSLRRSSRDAELRRFLARMVAAVLLVCWEPMLRNTAHAAASAIGSEALHSRLLGLFWLGRELVWWWLVAGLVAIALCDLRRFLPIAGFGAALSGAAPSCRQDAV